MKKYINPLLTAGSLLFLLTTIYFQNERINQFKVEVKTLQSTTDSLWAENTIISNSITRYELAVDHLNEINPEATLQFVNFMNHETE